MTDVCLILEETYPYIVGGVSSWVHSLITGLPDIKFSLVHISMNAGKARQAKFELPPNLCQVVEVAVTGHRKPEEAVGRLEVGLDIPPASIYHALSTGFAGMIGSQIKQQTKKPFILTEHGIYWKEIESGADEVECGFQIMRMSDDQATLCARRDYWIATFREWAKSAYDNADEVVTVCQANQELQLTFGVLPDKCSVIPNGVEVSVSGHGIPEQFSPTSRFRIGFVGRIVPMKDIKTLISAYRLVSGELADAELLLIGPMDQDEGYYHECLNLVREAGLSTRLRFIGEADPRNYYPYLDVLVLTSISEGQPLVVLEAMSAGVPVVVTDVGGCSELVHGINETDCRIGAAGIVTPSRDPEATARAILKIAGDSRLAEAMSSAARKRIGAFYTRDKLLGSYRKLYAKYGGGQDGSAQPIDNNQSSLNHRLLTCGEA